MVDTPYSGAATRAAHYASRPPVSGVNADHFKPDPEPDPFMPAPKTPSGQEGSIMTGDQETAGQSNQPNLASVPIQHWYAGQPSVPSGIPYGRAQQAMQERMMVDHSPTSYVADTSRNYKHFSDGQVNEFIVGRMPQNAGEDPGERLQYLVNGTNSYDHTNQPNEVYAGDTPNVGRYRLGVKTNVFGLYENPLGKFGQDAHLHAYTGLSPYFPRDVPPLEDTAPYTPNSRGMAHWIPAPFAQIPSLFSIPSETALTDYLTMRDRDPGSEFVDRNEDF